MDSDDNDSSIFALLAASSDDGDQSTLHRELPPLQVWAEHVLVDAWSAAMNEFKAYASPSSSAHSLDREQQLLASPLWYAPPCPSKPSSSSSRPAKRPHSSVSDVLPHEEAEEEALDEEEEFQDGVSDEQEQVIEYVEEIELEQVVLPAASPAAILPDPPRHNVNVHPSRLDHVQHNDPFFNPAEWQPVSSSSKRKSSKKVVIASSETPSTGLVIPDPPPVEQAIPQEQALLDSQTSQQALEHALQAWYTAGYAAALYHVRSGAVKP